MRDDQPGADDRLMRQQAELLEDLATAVAYGEARLSEWSFAAFDNDADPVRLRLHFAARLETHRANLWPRLKRPALIDILPAARSAADRRRVRTALERWVHNRARAAGWTTWAVGEQEDRVVICLPATAGAAADDLRRRYGDAVAVSITSVVYAPNTPRPLPPLGGESFDP